MGFTMSSFPERVSFLRRESFEAMKKFLSRVLLCALLLFSSTVLIAGSSSDNKKFDAGALILEHIGDAHDWHILTWNGHSVSVPLPVILYHEDRGLTAFWSSRFEHGEKAYNGYRLDHAHIIAVKEDGTIDEAATAKIWDVSITKNTAAMFFSMIFMLWIFISMARTYTRNKGNPPKGIQSFLEPIIIFVRDDIARASIGEKKYKRYMPFLLTLFFFILLNNLLGLVPILPGGTNLTGNIAITLTLAIFTFIITTVSGNKNYWRHIIAMPGVPKGILIILTPIEIMGMFLKPFVLMIRLFANITAGHIIMLSFFSLIFIFGELNPAVGYAVSIASIAFTIFMFMLELLVGFIQAYVFALLSAMYFGMAVEEHH